MARAEPLEARGHRRDAVLAADLVLLDAEFGGMVGDHAVQPLAERLALATRRLARRLAGIEPDTIDVPGNSLVHRPIRGGQDPCWSEGMRPAAARSHPSNGTGRQGLLERRSTG